MASAMVGTSQQVGGSIGTALPNTVAAGGTTSWVTAHAAGAADSELAQRAAVHGYAVALGWGAGIMALGALIALVFVNAGNPGTVAGSEESVERTDAPAIAH